MGLVAVVAIGSVWVVWDAYNEQVERSQAGIFDADAPEVVFGPLSRVQTTKWTRPSGRLASA